MKTTSAQRIISVLHSRVGIILLVTLIA